MNTINKARKDKICVSWRHSLISAYWKTRDHPTKLRMVRWLGIIFRTKIICGKTESGVLLWLDPNDYVQRNILQLGNYELNTVRLIRKLVQNVKCFWDVGAHIGQYTLEAASVMARDSMVVAIEANPDTFTHLLDNIRLNGATHVSPLLTFLNDEPIIVGMEEPDKTNTGRSRQAQVCPDYWTSSTSVQKALKYFDRAPEVVKIDVEGGELLVLESLLSATHPEHIIFEFIPQLLGGNQEAILSLLTAHGYVVSDVTGKPYSVGPLLEDNLWATKAKSA